MSPAKLLGLPQTDDSIILRTRDPVATTRPSFVERPRAEEGDAHEVLRHLIAMRRRGDTE